MSITPVGFDIRLLLDLCMTDLDETKCKVVPKVADHKGLWVSLPLDVGMVSPGGRLGRVEASLDANRFGLAGLQ